MTKDAPSELPEGFDNVARSLHAAWLRADDRPSVDQLLAPVPVPGPVALRARYHFVIDAVPAEGANLGASWETWLEQLLLETRGDAALVANDTEAAQGAFSELVCETAVTLADQLARIHGLIGLGDAARQQDDVGSALSHYERALDEAVTIGHRFGEARALVPLGYLALTSATALEAKELFDRAERIAVDLDERLYLANALIGKGEALQRLREEDMARQILRRALGLAEQLRSHVAIGNAAQRLADLELRLGERERVGELLARAADAFEAAGAAIGAAAAADGSADLLLADGRITESAEQYQRAIELSRKAGYRRGEAHALTGLARCAEATDRFESAAALQRIALPIYESLDDLIGQTSARSGLARVATALGDEATAIDEWLTVIEGIETMRSLRERLDLQEEYRLRFSEAYSGALQAAVRSQDPTAFVVVFESLAGRRLAGLIDQASGDGDAELVGHLLAASDHRAFRDPYPANPTKEQRVRRLGAVVMRAGLVEPAEKGFSDIVAHAYRVISREEAADLLRYPSTAETLLLAPIPAQESRVAWMCFSASEAPKLGVTSISELGTDLLARFGASGWSDGLQGSDFDPMRVLIPPELRDRLSDGTRPLLLLPLDRLWSVPWPAVPLDDGRFIGEVVPLTLAPSLSLSGVLARHASLATRTPRPVVVWRSPAIARHDLEPVFVDDPAWRPRPISESWELKEALLRHDPDDPLVVIACHGYPIAGLGHYLELAPGQPLTPIELLNAQRAPQEIVLVSCWGAIAPDAPAGESLTIATLALTRGSVRVAASVAELGDSIPATRFVQAFLHRLRDRPMAVALRDATARVLSEPAFRNGPLRDWSPLVVVGAP